MSTSKVSNGMVQSLSSLGKIREFEMLSEKRITKCIREALRLKYGNLVVRVSCSAEFRDSRWYGVCWIEGEKLNYTISTL
jgi:hypothetical protein